MTINSGSAAQMILARALECLERETPNPLTGPETIEMSERCVELPWVAAYLGAPGRLLDVGWAMSPPEWLGVLLAIRDRGADLTGIDIIDPQRVRSRYPADQVDAVLSIPARVEDILNANPTSGLYDTISCVSTLEHIGFDIASPPEDLTSAFVRAPSAETAIASRAPETDRLFLDAAHRLLAPGGHLLISVPAGSGLPILHQDSLGLFTHQFEYDEASWARVTGDNRFSVLAEAYYRHDETSGWSQVETFAQLSGQTSAMQPFATGCALVRLRHISS